MSKRFLLMIKSEQNESKFVSCVIYFHKLPICNDSSGHSSDGFKLVLSQNEVKTVNLTTGIIQLMILVWVEVRVGVDPRLGSH